jgi:hypothetical protein
VVTAHYKKTICWTVGLAVRIFPATTRTFTKDTAMSERGRCAAWHVWINGTAWQGNGMLCVIGLKVTTGTRHARQSVCLNGIAQLPTARIYVGGYIYIYTHTQYICGLITKICRYQFYLVSRDSSIGIATMLRVERSRDRIPVAGEILLSRSDREWGPPSVLYNKYQVSFPGVKDSGLALTPLTPVRRRG